MKQVKSAMGLFALLITLTIISCKDDEGTKSRVDLLTQHQWKISSGTPPDHALVKAAVDLGVEYSFRKDGTYTSNDVISDEPSNGVWEFNSDETKIITDKGEVHEGTTDISILNESNLEFTSTNASQTLTFLFVKK